MPSPPARVARIVEDRVELSIPKDLAERTGLATPDENLFVFAPGGSVLLLAKEGGGKGYFVGNLETLSVAEVFGFVSSAIRTGTLVLQTPAAKRRIVFHEGQVTFAASSELSERLGPVLWRNGYVKPEQLKQVEPKVNATNKLGKLLIDAGFLSAAQLYRGMQLQVQDIVLGAFIEGSGEVAFIEGDSAELNVIKPAQRTRDLVLEGMARAEKMQMLRQNFDPGSVLWLVDRGGVAPKGLEQTAVFDAVDGMRTTREVARASRLGEFVAMNALAELVQGGLVQVGPKPQSAAPPKPPAAPTASGPELFAVAYKRVFAEYKAANGIGRLRTYFQYLPDDKKALFADVTLADDGRFESEKVVANAQKLNKGAMGRALALEALDGFLNFALFDALNFLPTAKAVELNREVVRMIRGK